MACISHADLSDFSNTLWVHVTYFLPNASRSHVICLIGWFPLNFSPSDTEAPFLDFDLYITNGIVSTKIYDKRDDFNFEIVNFPFLDGDVPRSPSYGVYISQLISFARACTHVVDFNNGNKFLTSKLQKRGQSFFF